MATTTTYAFNPLTGPTSVNATTAGDQFSSDIVTLADGTSVMAYVTFGGGLFLRALSAGGAGSGAEAAVATGIDLSSNHFANLAVLTNGNIVVTWADNAANQNIHYRIYSPGLLPLTGVLDIPNGAKADIYPDVAALSGGGFVIVHQYNLSVTDHDIYAYTYSAAGMQVGAVSVSTSPATVDNAPSVVGLTDGGFAIAHERASGADTAMWRSVWNANGSMRLADTQFDDIGSHNRGAILTRLGAGFAVNYIDNGWGGGNDDVTLWRFDANGATGLTDYARASVSAGDDVQVAAAVSSDGYTALGFFTNDDIEGALVSPDGVALIASGALDRNADQQSLPAVSWIDRTHFALIETVGASAPGNDGAGFGVAARVFEVRRTIAGDGANDIIVAPSGDGILNALDGGAGDDVLIGGALGDILIGGLGNDTLNGGAGTDQMSGGGGNDVYVVDNAGDVVTENAGEGTDTVSTGLAVYTLSANVENLNGTNAAGQTLIGNNLGNVIIAGNGPNTIFANGGDDYVVSGATASTIDGGAGNDQMYGGAGNDYMVGGDGNDVIVGFGGADSLYGGAGDDYLVAGDGAGAVVDGGAGANSLWGAGGNDYIVGGEGADLEVGAAGSDFLFANAGDDTLYGGQGTDFLFGNAGNDFIWTDDVGLPQAQDFIYVGGGTGVDTVADFTAGNAANHDVVVISPASGIGNFAQLQAAMVQVGVYTVITMSGGDQLFLYNVQPFQLTAADFLFF